MKHVFWGILPASFGSEKCEKRFKTEIWGNFFLIFPLFDAFNSTLHLFFRGREEWGEEGKRAWVASTVLRLNFHLPEVGS